MSGLNRQYRIVQQFVLASCLLAGNLQATGTQQYSAELLQPREWQEIGSKTVRGGDMLILSDGTRLTGYLEKVPALHYSFGPVCLDVNRVAAIAFGALDGEPKMQVITRDGQNFVAAASPEPITFMEKVEGADDAYAPKSIDPNSVHYIVLQQRQDAPPQLQQKFYHVTMNNGDQVSVVLENEQLVLSDGKNERTIHNEQLVDAIFNGGLRGTIDGLGCQEQIGFSFVKDQHLGMRIVSNDHGMRMPWEAIDRVTVDHGEYTARPADVVVTEIFQQPMQEIDTKQIAYLDMAHAVQAYVEAPTPIKESPVNPPVGSITTENMIFVPGGSFLVSVDESTVDKETGLRSTTYGGRLYTNLLPTVNKPSFLVELAPFYSDKHQVTNAQYAQFVAATGHPAPKTWANGQLSPEMDQEPVINISYRDASAYAEWAGKRLPSEVEWQRASEEASALHAVAIKAQKDKENALQDQVFTILSLISGFETVFAAQEEPQLAFGRIVQGASGSVSEWTSSSAAADPTSPMGRVNKLYHANVAKYGDYRVIRSGFVAEVENPSVKPRWRLQQDDCSTTTGFRCIVDTL